MLSYLSLASLQPTIDPELVRNMMAREKTNKKEKDLKKILGPLVSDEDPNLSFSDFTVIDKGYLS